jgi:hypothetical protein
VTFVAIDVCQELIRGAVTIIAAGTAAAVAAWLGLKVFLRQKQFDLVKQRYLEGAIDIIAAHHEEVMGIYNHNWARCLQILKLFRDEKDEFHIDELEKGFLPLDSSQFHAIAHYRLQLLVGSQVFWKVYQLALSFTVNSNAQVTKEVPETIRIKLTTNKINAEISEIVEESFKHLEKLNAESHKFALLTHELEGLAQILQETKNITFKKVNAFRNRQKVKAAIDRLEKAFSDQLREYRGSDA